MNEDDVPGGEEAPPDDRDVAIQYWSNVVVTALGPLGLVYVEGFTCPKCDHRQFASHTGAEILTCHKCQTRCASKAPKHPVEGEVCLDHMTLALNTLHGIAKQQQKEGLSPISPAEFQSLTPDVQLLLTRQAASVRVTTLEKAVAVARSLASLD